MAIAPLSQTLFLTEDGSTIAVTSANAVTIPPRLPPLPTFPVAPSISGTPTVGETLTGSSGVVSNGSVSGRQWLRDGEPISGATAATYTLTAEDAGLAVAFQVTAIGAGGKATATSPAVTVAPARRSFFSNPFFSNPFFTRA